MNPFQIALVSMILSLVPILIWASIFLYKHGEKQHLVLRIFMLGALMVVPLIAYRSLWSLFPSLNLNQALSGFESTTLLMVPLNMIFLFITVGIVEEYLKNHIARRVDTKEVTSIDDAIEFSIIAALGFSFAENTFYFIQVYKSLGSEILLQVVVFRSLFSTFAHVLFSTIYGYHFGLALFAKPVYKEMSKNRLDKKLVNFIHKITKFKKTDIFEDQQLFAGLFYASMLHAAFNILLGLGYTSFLVPFLVLGFIHIMLLLSRKENQVEYAPEEID